MAFTRNVCTIRGCDPIQFTVELAKKIPELEGVCIGTEYESFDNILDLYVSVR